MEKISLCNKSGCERQTKYDEHSKLEEGALNSRLNLAANLLLDFGY